jgi:hypothetical protein
VRAAPQAARATAVHSLIPEWRPWAWVFCLAGFFFGFGCESGAPSVSTGGETHFLRICDPMGAPCEGPLNCQCGVCTVTCVDDSACSIYPGSSCTEAIEIGCGNEQPASVCDASCAEDGDCTAVSSAHRCVGGACRLGVDNVGGGEGGAPPDTGSCPASGVTANEVLLIGDSFFATSHQITAFLEALARSAGVLQTGERYRDVSRLTNNALAWSGEGLRDQYESASAEAEAQVVIVAGGGADTLLGTCETVDAQCPAIVAAELAFEELLLTMANDGISDVILVSYPNPVPPLVREKMDILRPMLESICAQSPIPCHPVDLRPPFEGNYDEFINADGLNPSAAGSEASADAIWAVMDEQCVAQ